MSLYLKQKMNWYVSKRTIWKLYKEHGRNRLKYKSESAVLPLNYSPISSLRASDLCQRGSPGRTAPFRTSWPAFQASAESLRR